VRKLRADQAAADAHGHEIGLVAEALGELQRRAEQPLEIQFYDDVLLTANGTLCDRGASARNKRPLQRSLD